MNRDTVQGAARSAVGQGEKILGQVAEDGPTIAQGYVDDAAGKARSAFGHAKDAVNDGAAAISSVDFSSLRDQIGQLTQKVTDLAQSRGLPSRDQLAQSAADAQDKFAAVESDVESRIRRNPWGAVAIAALIGLLIGKMT